MSPSVNAPERKKIPPKPKYKDDGSWVGTLFGWAFILMSLGVIYYMIVMAKPEGSMVCDRIGRTSLTSFGTCHVER